MKKSECQFSMAECSFLGDAVGKGMVKPETGKIKGFFNAEKSQHSYLT